MAALDSGAFDSDAFSSDAFDLDSSTGTGASSDFTIMHLTHRIHLGFRILIPFFLLLIEH
jgi:hypothetical protein